jgi:formylglycine-generating enzyme required for sulfatase activity
MAAAAGTQNRDEIWGQTGDKRGTQSPTKVPTGPTSGSFRVVRGGSWVYDARGTRSASRNGDVADSRGNYGGFRSVRELD